MLLLTLDEKSNQPMYRQILDQIREKIETRQLRPGERLASTRRLAEQLGIHRSTVSIAYQELWSLGFVELRPGSRPRVRARMRMATEADPAEQGAMDWGQWSSPAGNDIFNTYKNFQTGLMGEKDESVIDFSTLHIDDRLFPVEQFRSSMNRALKRYEGNLLGYGDPVGFLPLREYLARRLRCHGISVTPGQLLITNGSQHGIDLVFRMLAAPGRGVAFEAPSYNYMLPLLRFAGLKPVQVPLRQDGMDLDVLERKIKTESPALVYTMPNFHNPAGITTSQAHRERLLSMCETAGIPIIEDGFEEEMKYFGKEVLPIKSMDGRNIVIYCGTFSKVLFPGARIGWVAADRECIERLTAVRHFSEIYPAVVSQAAMYEFCQYGYYDRHINKMHRIFRKRMQATVSALRRYISTEWAEWKEPNGGYLVWLKLKPLAADAEPVDWETVLASYGVKLAPGRFFFFSGTPGTYLRLSIASLNEEEIKEGIRRLAKGLEDIHCGNGGNKCK
ncbi:MAG: PLP-dependent aminotransferase family protein [bacterium]|nr:PLP-dependent aminotransferase family protein [bacterium]